MDTPMKKQADISAPGNVVRTAWTTSDIWLRRKFEWKADPAVKKIGRASCRERV